jgi:hypothetical protein
VLLVDGERAVPGNPERDTVTKIDLNGPKPEVMGEVQATASVVGPPHSVAVAPDESFALVTGNQKIDPADPIKTLPDDKVTVIDLQASSPNVVATLQIGSGPRALRSTGPARLRSSPTAMMAAGENVPRLGVPQWSGETPLDRSIERQDDRVDNSICSGFCGFVATNS